MLDLLAISHHMPVLETDSEIMQMVDIKKLPSITCSTIDNLVGGFPRMEFSDELLECAD